MSCPCCNTQNLATSVRCSKCGTTLIYEAEGHSDAYRKGASSADKRMYGGIGSAMGFCFVFFILKFVLTDLYLDDNQIYGASLGGAIAGGISGRLAAWLKWRES